MDITPGVEYDLEFKLILFGAGPSRSGARESPVKRYITATLAVFIGCPLLTAPDSASTRRHPGGKLLAR
jgi:hypothetical protein